MTYERPTLVVFQGGARNSQPPLEALLLRAQSAAALDLLLLAGQTGAFRAALLVTEDEVLVAEAQALSLPLSLTVEPASEPFHFGTALREVCRKHGLSRVVYAGGASLPLADGDLLIDLARSVSGVGECVVANSLFSADYVALHPASALSRIEPPATDNNLAWLLHYTAGLPFAASPRTLATQFDIDTPPDLATLLLALEGGGIPHASVGPRVAEVLTEAPAAMPQLYTRLEAAYRVMATRRAQVFVGGRVSAWVWRRLEVNLPCQTRVLSEERGMQAGGREARGEVRSLLGLHIDAVGLPGFIRSLEETCDAAFLDTRVLFAHRRLQVSRPDRFHSDALMPDLVTDPWVRDLTYAMREAHIPIVPGGHSLVAGGVWALSERVRASGSAG
jgi:hypothetical protein